MLLILLRLLLEGKGRGRKDAVERRNREEGTMSPCEEEGDVESVLKEGVIASIPRATHFRLKCHQERMGEL